MKIAPPVLLLIFLTTLPSRAGVARSIRVNAPGSVNPAQQPASGPQIPSIHVEVREVLIPMVVTDARGHNIVGLRSSDFRVFEDGVEQRIVSLTAAPEGADKLFLPQPAPPTPGIAPISPLAEGIGKPNQIYLVAIDTLNSRFENFVQVRDALKKLFSKQESGSLLYGLVALSRSVKVVEPLTNDPTAVLHELEDKQFTNFIQESESSSRALQEPQLRKMLDDYCLKCPCDRNGPGGPCSSGPELSKIEAFATSSGEQDAGELQAFLQHLQDLAAQLGALPGKRTLVLISDGFTIQPGRNLFDLIAIYLNDPGIAQRDPVPPLDAQVNAVLRTAHNRNVVFYTLDSRGVYVVPAGGDDVTGPPGSWKAGPIVMPKIEQQKRLAAVANDDGLVDLAEATGGLFFGNSNDLLKGLRQVLADGRSYYVLAYNPLNEATDGKFRKIQVTVDKKNLRIRAKQGYWAPAQ